MFDESEPPTPGTVIITRAFGAEALLSNGVIYLGGDDPVSAYNASDGSLLWSNTKLWKNTTENSPILQMIANGILYLTIGGSSSAKGLYALDASSGKLLWKQLGKNLFVGAINNGVLYASSDDYDLPPVLLTPKPLKSDDNVIMALDARTGIVHWVYGTGSEIANIIAQ